MYPWIHQFIHCTPDIYVSTVPTWDWKWPYQNKKDKELNNKIHLNDRRGLDSWSDLLTSEVIKHYIIISKLDIISDRNKFNAINVLTHSIWLFYLNIWFRGVSWRFLVTFVWFCNLIGRSYQVALSLDKIDSCTIIMSMMPFDSFDFVILSTLHI